jgi:hypothetical protein
MCSIVFSGAFSRACLTRSAKSTTTSHFAEKETCRREFSIHRDAKP